MIFQVRRFKGPDKPQNGCEDVEAESAHEAAEIVCGERLTDRGSRGTLRAMVLTNSQANVPLTHRPGGRRPPRRSFMHAPWEDTGRVRQWSGQR